MTPVLLEHKSKKRMNLCSNIKLIQICHKTGIDNFTITLLFDYESFMVLRESKATLLFKSARYFFFLSPP